MGESGCQDLICLQNRDFGSTLLGGALVTYCCNNPSQTEWLKKINIYYLTVSVGQTLGAASLGPLFQGFPQGCKQRVSQGCAFIWRLNRGRTCFPVQWALAVFSPQGCWTAELSSLPAVRLRVLVPPWLLERGHPHFMLWASPHVNLLHQSL